MAIIDDNVKAPSPLLETVPPPRYEDKNKANVASQLRDVVAKGSPLMTQAETRAKQGMASRGLLNSSMAVGAGQRAVYDVGMPLAQQQAGYHQELNRMARGSELERGTMSHATNLGRGTMGYQSDLSRGEMQLGAGLTRGTMSHAADLERSRMGYGAELEKGLMSHGSSLEQGLMNLADSIQQGQMRLSTDLQERVLSTAEGLKRGTMAHGAELEKQLQTLDAQLQRETMGVGAQLEAGLINARSDADIRRDWANMAQQLQLQDSAHVDALDRMAAENSQLLERMSAEQRYNLEKTVMSSATEIQKLMISEIGAINRTQGLTAEQQNAAVDQVLARAEGHMQYINDMVTAAPSWDPLFEGLPDLGAVATPPPGITQNTIEQQIEAAIARQPAPAPAPAPALTWSQMRDRGGYGTCLRGDTLVAMADGTRKAAHDIQVDEWVLTVGGPSAVRAIEISTVGDRKMVQPAPNVVLTEEHPFLYEGHWVALDSETANNPHRQYSTSLDRTVHPMPDGAAKILTEAPDTEVYDFYTDSGKAMVVGKRTVVGASPVIDWFGWIYKECDNPQLWWFAHAKVKVSETLPYVKRCAEELFASLAERARNAA